MQNLYLPYELVGYFGPFPTDTAILRWLTGSHPNSEVKQCQAQVVLGWGTTWEGWVLYLFSFMYDRFLKSMFEMLFKVT